MSDTAPLLQTVTVSVAGTATAVDNERNVAVAPYGGSVNLVTYTPETTLSGVDTNSRTITLVNKGQTGTGTTIIATKAFTAGQNAAADDETTIPLSPTAGNRLIQNGDVLAWQSLHVGTGLADPGGLAKIEFLRG